MSARFILADPREAVKQHVQMRLSHRARIERQVGVAAKRVLPRRQQQEGRREQRKGSVNLQPAKFAALHATGENALDQGKGPAQHRVGVELGDGGEVAGCSHDQLGYRGQVAVQQLEKSPRKQPQELGT